MANPCIVTKYLGPTTYRGARVKASHRRDAEVTWSITIPWSYKLSALENHKEAADCLLDKWDLIGDFVIVNQGYDHNHYYFFADSV